MSSPSDLTRTENTRKVFYTIGDVRAVVAKRANEAGEWVAVLQYKGQTLPDSEAFESDSDSAHGTAQALALHLAHRVRMGQFPN